MAIIARGHTPCTICGKALMPDDRIVATTAFAHPLDPFYRYSDTGMHRRCYDSWAYRAAFTARYRAVLARLDPPNAASWPCGPAIGPDVPQFEPEPWRVALQQRRPGIYVAPFQRWEKVSAATLLLGVRAEASDGSMLQAFPSCATIGPVQRLRDLVEAGDRGIAATPLASPPPPLPRGKATRYFSLDPGAGALWAELDGIAGVAALAIHLRGEWPPLAMHLWALPPA